MVKLIKGIPAYAYWQKKRTESLQKNPLKKTPIKQRSKWMKKVGKKRGTELAIYKVLGKDYLNDHPICECGRCGGKPSTEIHHKRGRGMYLNVVKYFMAVCRECHAWVHRHSKDAIRLGWLISRFAGDDWEDYAEEEYITEDAEFEIIEPEQKLLENAKHEHTGKNEGEGGGSVYVQEGVGGHGESECESNNSQG